MSSDRAADAEALAKFITWSRKNTPQLNLQHHENVGKASSFALRLQKKNETNLYYETMCKSPTLKVKQAAKQGMFD